MANYGQVLSLVFSCLQRESYYADLMSKNEQGRMGDQDAEPVPLPSDMLRLTEFIRDSKQPAAAGEDGTSDSTNR